ncbi:hypothetical protein [Microbacterium sp. Leaf159]|uniref:hypothetical protein n=1 Tax=Microbacterium sp. Leaf159 TaxID=1736279 RepID=UPI0006F3D1C6|nr:hypothetical protein [Microbacterium sp. Leaf159]KQR39208.1 hypothetical protein ASF80_07210 [Microbacterium sp. Leaf159]
MSLNVVVVAVEETSEDKGWWASWWDFSSFGPDALIGIGTGLIVAMIVLGTERRLAKRTRSLEVTNAEAAVVEKARSVLRHPLVWDPDFYDLKPSRTHLDRLVPVVQAVPSGDPIELFPGSHHAHRVVDLLDDLEASEHAIDGQRSKYESTYDLMAVPDAVGYNIRRLLRPPHDPMWLWEWPKIGDRIRVTADLRDAIESDMDLRQFIDEYVRNRRLLEAHREAFNLADGSWRADEWTALLQLASGAPHNPVKKLWRKVKYDRAVQAAKARADASGQERLLAIDAMAY